MIIQIIGAFVAVVALSVIFSIPKKFLVYSGIVGAVGWFIYLVFLRLNFAETTSVFIATLVVALISHSFARIFKAPVTVFLISGILPMVPGVGMYRIVYSMLSEDSSMTAYYFNHTLQIAGLIAIAIFIMDTFFRMVKKR
ncbi:threonine/serine exporter family protein [Clostridium sp. Marseille-P299]|uniref:threonine/serine exporter family protein n=1 Tax=Clostridium sp. Marseille-P299 TaxID=1805477 RepID=UPI000833634F|nr:threonine/serine exporter family protein [Clostridium sp. Marseille-P299]